MNKENKGKVRNLSENFAEKLKGFDEVWKRVEKAGGKKAPPPGMPEKKPVSRAVRFIPQQRQG